MTWNDDEHCYHHQHDDRCGGYYEDCDDHANDSCVHCPCCCTCLGCEYGPRDGLIAVESATPAQAAALGELQGGNR